MKRIVNGLVVAGLVLVAQAPAIRAQDEGIALGKPAPVVSVPDLEGRPVDLGQYIGKRPVLLEFWATWCEICEALLPRMEAAHKKYGAQVAFLGVNVAVNQSRDRVRRYIERHHMAFPILYDEGGVSVRAYDAPATSFIVVIDKAGRVVYTGIGTDQKFEQALQTVTGG